MSDLSEIGVYTFTTLYKRDSKGRCRQWDIRIDRVGAGSPGMYAQIVTTSGLVDIPSSNVTHVKDIQRNSKAGAVPRAIGLARTKSKNKRKDGYCETEDDAMAFVQRKPMLSKCTYINEVDAIKKLLPCIGEPKLDGLRGVWHKETLTLESRELNEWSRVPHIKRLLLGCPPPFDLDGELFVSGMLLQDIIHNVKCKASEDKDKIQYWVFDSPSRDEGMTYVERKHRLAKWHESLPDHVKGVIKLLGFKYLSDFDEAKDYYNELLDARYEGLMLKQPESPYSWNKRVSDSTKVKPVYTDEFKICAVEINGSTGTDLIEFVCEFINVRGVPAFFEVVPKWTKETRAKVCEDPEWYIDKPLTVEYRGKSKQGTPLHAVGIAIRDYE